MTSEPRQWDLNRQSPLTATMPSLDPAVIAAAQRKVVRECPDDFPEILDALGIP